MEVDSTYRDNTLDAEIFYDEANDAFDSVEIKNIEGIYKLKARVVSGGKQKSIKIGLIDIKKKKCKFFDRDRVLSAKLLTAFYRCCLHCFLIEKGGFLLHSCAVVKGDKAYIFSGPGGCGKSTVAMLSKPLKILADDFVCIRKINQSYYAYPTPWYDGKQDRGYEIKSILFLKQDEQTSLLSLSRGEVVRELMANMYYNTLNSNILYATMDMFIELSSFATANILNFSLKYDLWQCIEKNEEDLEKSISNTHQIA